MGALARRMDEGIAACVHTRVQACPAHAEDHNVTGQRRISCDLVTGSELIRCPARHLDPVLSIGPVNEPRTIKALTWRSSPEKIRGCLTFLSVPAPETLGSGNKKKEGHEGNRQTRLPCTRVFCACRTMRFLAKREEMSAKNRDTGSSSSRPYRVRLWAKERKSASEARVRAT